MARMNSFVHRKNFALGALFFVALSLYFSILETVSAQSIIDFSIQTSPQYPKPFENVSLSLTSYSVDLDKAAITWILDGKTALSGTGKKTFSFKTGRAGSASRVSVSVEDDTGILNKSVTINPSSIDIVWQAADSYTPPFYRGKALPATGSILRIVAMPEIYSNGVAAKVGSLVYKWSRNGGAETQKSGYGRYYADFQNSYLNQSEKISVTAETATGGGNAKGEIAVDILEPLVLFYEQSPLAGIKRERALSGDFNLVNEEITVAAEPYFFSVPNKSDGRIIYSWFLNGKLVPGNPDDQSSIVLRRESGSGSSRISLSMKHSGKILQEAANFFVVNFGER